MKRQVVYLAIVVLSAIGCTNDLLDEYALSKDEYNHIQFSIIDATEVVTRSEASNNERIITDAFLLVFYADGSYKAAEKVKLENITGTNGSMNRSIKSQLIIENGNKVVVLINSGQNTIPSGYNFQSINNHFLSNNWNINQVGADSGKGLPMSGWITWNSSTANIIRLKRSIAKVQLAFDSKLTFPTDIAPFNVNTTTWTICNYPNIGNIFQEANEVALQNLSNTTFFTAVDESFTRYPIGSSNLYEKQVFYMPEFKAETTAKKTVNISSTAFHKDRICLLIKNAGKYYRIDFAEKGSDGKYNWLSILRNCHYTVKITKVKSQGYPTITDALNSPASNIEYNIIVSDANDNLTISNGQYALELEYDKLIAYTNKSAELTLKARVILPNGISMPALNQISTNGITLSNPSVKLGISEQIIKFKLNGTSGSMTLNIGNISKTVTVNIIEEYLDAHCDIKTFTGNFANVKWVKSDNILFVSSSSSSVQVRSEENVTPIAWMRYDTNVTSTESDPLAEPVFEIKLVEGYMWEENSELGRTKIILTQLPPDYVGWAGGEPNQTGETSFSKRLIVEAFEENTSYIPWSTGFTQTKITDIYRGLANTRALFNLGDSYYKAAYECWSRNDKNKDGVIDDTEISDKPWYLPAQNQMIEIWLSYPNLNYKFKEGYYYLTSTEYLTDYIQTHLSRFQHGHMHYGEKTTPYILRCVKDM